MNMKEHCILTADFCDNHKAEFNEIALEKFSNKYK